MLCSICKVNPRHKGKRCKACVAAVALAQRRNSKGLCAKCTVNTRTATSSYCIACLCLKNQEYKQAHQDSPCTQCGIGVRIKQSVYCAACTKIRRQKAPEAQILIRAKKNAKAFGREFTLELMDIVIPSQCPVLGMPLVLSHKHVKDDSPSLDRLDSTKGYIKGNVWVISQRANRIKNDATLDELRKLVQALERKMK